MRALGIDTSNYTTSAAVFDGSGGYNAGRLLEVRPGELGLRQSDALFQHIKHLPGRFAELQAEGWLYGSNIFPLRSNTRLQSLTHATKLLLICVSRRGKILFPFNLTKLQR